LQFLLASFYFPEPPCRGGKEACREDGSVEGVERTGIEDGSVGEIHRTGIERIGGRFQE